jgi:hypothetical protein
MLEQDWMIDMFRSAGEPVRLVIYGDFNCPFSALASARAAGIEARALAEIDWRTVEHDDTIPPTGEATTPEVREAFENELTQIRALLVAGETDRLRVPGRRVNTRLVTAAYAATAKSLRPQLREELFAAYWARGEDLSEPDVIERLGANECDDSTAARWRSEWLSLAKPIVPVMILPDGYNSRGLGALTRLAQFARDGDAKAGRVQ